MTPTPNAASQIAVLADSARSLAERGEKVAAENIYRAILEKAPYHVRALMYLSVRALERGESAESRKLLERVIQADPNRPLAYQNLGIVHRANGHSDLALAAFDHAIALQPDYALALLHKGSLLESLGHKVPALACYKRGLECLPRKAEELVADPATPGKVRDLVKYGAEFVRDSLKTAVSAHLGTLHELYGETALKRIESAARWLEGGISSPPFARSLQRPSYLYLPDVDPHPFFDRSNFDWASALEAHTPAIQAEFESILESRAGITPYVEIDDKTNPQQWRELNHSSQWSSFQLIRGGKVLSENTARCPATMEALHCLPIPDIPDHAPEMFFSILAPGAHIPPHYGLGNYKLAVHLPLMVPPDCGIRVGNETRNWTEGECLVFDDSFQHEAWNRSQEPRAVLIAETWNPLLTEVEKQGIRALIAALADFNHKAHGSHGA